MAHPNGSAPTNRSGSDSIRILFPKRKSNLFSIYKHKETNKHRVTLEDWSRQSDVAARKVLRKQASCSTAQSGLYQILGLFFVFQGVLLTAVAQANLLTCHNWKLPFLLCLLTYVAAFLACLQKLTEIRNFRGQVKLEQAHHKGLQKSIEALKEKGVQFDIYEGQPDLEKNYQEPEITGSGSLASIFGSVSRLCRVWIISYTGAVLFILSAFSGLTLFSIHQILCDPGSSAPSPPQPAHS